MTLGLKGVSENEQKRVIKYDEKLKGGGGHKKRDITLFIIKSMEKSAIF